MKQVLKFVAKEGFKFGVFATATVLITTAPEIKKYLQSIRSS